MNFAGRIAADSKFTANLLGEETCVEPVAEGRESGAETLVFVAAMQPLHAPDRHSHLEDYSPSLDVEAWYGILRVEWMPESADFAKEQGRLHSRFNKLRCDTSKNYTGGVSQAF